MIRDWITTILIVTLVIWMCHRYEQRHDRLMDIEQRLERLEKQP